jgi:hypothetical protein
MPADDMAAANETLADPPDVDLSTSQRFGLHVVSRLARRQGIHVRLTTTADGGVTAVVVLPPGIFVASPTTATPDGAPDGAPDGFGPGGIDRRPERSGYQDPTPSLPPARTAPNGRSVPVPIAAAPAPVAANPVGSPVADRPQAPRDEAFFGGDVRDDGWRGWWDDAATALDAAPPIPPAMAGPARGVRIDLTAIEATATETSTGTGTGDGAPAGGRPPRLAHRTPQAHLAPELRRTNGSEPAEADPEARGARDALSQYQASRLAALDTGDLLDRRGGRADRDGGTPR